MTGIEEKVLKIIGVNKKTEQIILDSRVISATAKEIKEGLEKIIFWFDYGLSKRKYTFGKFAKIYFKKDWEQFWKEFDK